MRMIHGWSGLTLERCLLTLSTLVFHLTAFLLLTQRGGQCEMIGSPEPIVAMIGEDIILPCHLEPSTNVVSMTLEWARLDLNPRFVHVSLEGLELLINQNQAYVGRTSLFTQKMQHGDLSLKLSKVRVSDEGTYRCLIPVMGSSEVVLLVGAVSPPVIIMGDISNSGLDLQCESSGWYPEPEVLWLDGEGNSLSAESAETVKGGDDLYSVSSRVTVERSNNINIICRVQQKKINQTRETNVQILDVCEASSNFTPCVVVFIAVALLMLSAVFFVLWRIRQRRGDKNPSDEESKKEEEERLFRETLKNEVEEEKKNMSEVLSLLEEQRKELENKRDKRKTVLNNSLEITEKTLKRTSDVISNFNLQKPSVENDTEDLKPDKNTETQQEQVKSKVLEREEKNTNRDGLSDRGSFT